MDQRSYLRGESRLQEDVEGEGKSKHLFSSYTFILFVLMSAYVSVSEEKQDLEIQGKLDESITLSAVQEIIPSLDKRYTHYFHVFFIFAVIVSSCLTSALSISVFNSVLLKLKELLE